MKTLIAAVFAMTMLGGAAADAAIHVGIGMHPVRHHRHQVCHMRHHHRVCSWR